MPEMNQIMIEFNKFSNIQSQDLKFTIKLSGSQPVTQDDDPNCFFSISGVIIDAFASGRINQKNILEQLKKKYPKIGLGVYFSTMQ